MKPSAGTRRPVAEQVGGTLPARTQLRALTLWGLGLSAISQL